MEEKDILLLQGLGYTVNEYGGIIDSNGQYLNQVEYNGQIIKSFQTPDEYKSMTERNNMLDYIGFKEDPDSTDNRETQEQVAIAKEHINRYVKDPTSVPTPAFDGNPVYNKAFEQFQKEDKEKHGGTYPSPESLQQNIEEGTILADFDNAEDKERFKMIEERLNTIKSIDPDVDTLMEESIKNEFITTGYGGIPMVNPGEKGNWAEKATFNTYKFLNDAISGIVKTFTPSGTGMEDEELKEEYLKLREERGELLKPIAVKKLDGINQKIDAYQERVDAWWDVVNENKRFGGDSEKLEEAYAQNQNDEIGRLQYALKRLKRKQNSLEDFISGKNYDTSIFTSDNLEDFASFGITDIADKLIYDLPIAKKVEKGEELSETEKALFDVAIIENDIDKAQFEQNFWHDVTGGVNESVKFLAGGIGGRSVGKTATKVIGRKLSGTTNQVVGRTADMAIQALLHPATYDGALDKYIGDFDVRYDENGDEILLARGKLYNTLQNELELSLNAIDDKMALARETGDTKAITELTLERKNLEKAKNRIHEPAGWGDAFTYGITETLKENLAEQYGGRIYQQIGIGKLEKALVKTPMGKALFNNKLSRTLGSVQNKGREVFNKTFGAVPGEKIIGSNTEEIFEEILVQATPTYGQSMDEYYDQVSELGTLDFYTKVAAQTLLMQKTFQTPGLAKKYWDVYSASPEVKQQRKEINKLYKELGNRNLTQNDFDNIMLKTGNGKYSGQDYNNAINKLKEEGLIDEANKMEQNKIYQQALHAAKLGKLSQFKKSLTKAKYNRNLSPETLVNIEKMKVEVDEMLNDENTYINKQEVRNLKFKKRYAQYTLDDINTERDKIDNLQVTEELDTIISDKLGIEIDDSATISPDNPKLKEYLDKNFDNLSEGLQKKLLLDIQEKQTNQLLEQINKKIKNVTSYDHQTYLMNEKDYFKVIDRINKREFGRNMTSSDFKKLIENQELKKVAKHIKPERLDEIHKQVITELERQEKNKTVASNQENENNKGETQTNITDQDNNQPQAENPSTETVIENQEQESPETVETPFGNVVTPGTEEALEAITLGQAKARTIVPSENEEDVDNATIQNNDELDFILPEDEGIDSLKLYADNYKQTHEQEPTFENFFDDSVKYLGGKQHMSKQDLKAAGQYWEAAGLGKSNWEQVYKDNYTNVGNIVKNFWNKNSNTQDTDTNKESVKNKQEVTGTINPLTGESLKVTPVVGKTTVVTAKANYNALKYKNTREIEQTEDGKRVVYYKEDTQEIPILNEDSFLDVKALVNPNNNGIGSILKPVISNEEDWGDERLKVSVTNEQTGEISEYISFPEWIKRNQPKTKEYKIKDKISISDVVVDEYSEEILQDIEQAKKDNKNVSITDIHGTNEKGTSVTLRIVTNDGVTTPTVFLKNEGMTLEEFQKTDEYIAKVPIYYTDSQGNKVAFVGDTDWYNPLNVRDDSKEPGEFIDLNNLTLSHQEKIKEGKENSLNLRKQIFSGEVQEVTIETKDGAKWNFLPPQDENGNQIPSKPLSVASPTSRIVFFSSDDFVGLDGGILKDDIVIENKRDLIKASLNSIKNGKPGINQAYYLSPVYKKQDGRMVYTAISVQRLNEANDKKAFTQDIETAKNILAANATISRGKKQKGMSIQDAKIIRDQVKLETGLDITNFDVANNIANSLISLDYKGKRKFTAFDKNIKLPGVDGTYFIDALFSDNSDLTPVQNTNLSINKSVGLQVTRNDNGTFTVKKLADNYEEFLKTRLFTNVVSYNVGTEESPVFTHSVQPVIELAPEIDDKPKINERLESIEIKEVTEDTTIEEVNQEAQNLIEELGGIDDFEDEFENDLLLPELNSTDELNQSLNVIPGLTLDQQEDVVNYLISSVAEEYDSSKELPFNEFQKLIKEKFDGLFKPMKAKLDAQYNNLNKVYQKNPEAYPQAERTLKILQFKVNKVNTVIDNYNTLFGKAYLEGVRKSLIPGNVRTNEDLQNEIQEAIEEEAYEKNFYQGSNEVIHKDKISKKLRRVFATIPNGEQGFLGIEKHEGYDRMYNTIATVLTSPLPTEPTFESMMDRLKTLSRVYPWMTPMIQKLEKADDEVKNSFTSNMYKYAAKAQFIAFTDQIDGMQSAVWFSNANNIKQKIKEHWNNEFKRSNITNNNTLNTEKLKKLAEQWDSWGTDKEKVDDTTLRQWLSDFGIPLSDGTWDALKSGKLVIGRGRKKKPLSFEQLFIDKSPNKLENRGDRLFSNLAKYAKKHMTAEQGTLDFVQNDKLHPFKDMNNILNSLIEIESKYNKTLINITRRDGDKTVSEIVFPNFFLNNMRKLIISAENQDGYLDELKATHFASNSVILDLLTNNPDFKDIFSYGETGLMSMKKIGGKTPAFSKIDQISPIDYMFHQRAMFQDMKVESFDHNHNGFSMRVGTVSTPTNSDKGRMMLMKTAVYDLFGNTDAFKKQGDDFNFSQELKDLLFEQLIVPELNRIVNHADTNIKDYNKGAVRFNLIPEINTLEADGLSVLDFLKNNKDKEAFKNKYLKVITDYLEQSIKVEANDNLVKTEEFIDTDKAGNQVDMFNNSDYLSDDRRQGTVQEKRYIAELDYTINSMIANMNTLQLIAGDPAMYFKSKGDPLSSDSNEQTKISRDLGTNLGKRLALMIAPGNVLAESQDEKYLQLFLEDNEEVANNAEEIIGWHYGKDSLKEEYNGKTYQELINQLRNKSISDSDLKQLQLRFDKVKDFLTIESTDAQEYTTLKEHLRVLVGSGKMTQAKADEIQKKSDEGYSLEKDLDAILQPIKPVYTGDMIENGVRRIMYIKSSSFPLIPDLVKGTKLEPLMNKMNELEKKHGYNVRASYQSANKVGAMSSPINPLDQDSLDKLDTAINSNGRKPDDALLLDRINFKIQQEVPYKSDYQTEDKVSMGTQIFKLLMGDGITDINGFELDGEKVSGKQLKEEFFKAFSSIIDMQKSTLLDSLGLEDDYTTDNPLEAAKSLQKLLVAEAEERGFSENDIKSLELESKTLSNGEVVYHFKLPLWFSGNSNKFESMLNAIINNKVFKQKLPGNSFVVGSENGITLREQTEGIVNDVVYIGDYRGGELKGNEVLAPAKIRVNGKMIDLFKKNKQGNYIYIKETENGYVINEDTIDPELFENFTFRTPTSSHGSASSIKIVGFIPTVQGDLMITPKNFIAQMGQDFDIDKLTSYQYWTYDNQGKIERLTQENVDYMLHEFEQKNKNNESVDKLLDAIGLEEVERKGMTYEQFKRKLDMKLAQNRFIEIHNAVYKNKSAEVQKKINKVLSMEFAETQAEAIDGLVTSNTAGFNILSPTYQMDKMIAGSTGASAIGIYAKGVTFNSIAQQSDKVIGLQVRDEVSDEFIKKEIRIGNISSDGTFGRLETISSNEDFETKYELKRRTAEVQDERVNTGTDNEKAQILGRVGITDLDAVAVDNLLSLLGIDAERTKIKKEEYDPNNPFHKTKLHNGEQIYYTEYSVPYLLHSQPIVKEYFTRLKNAKGITQEYKENIEESIYNELMGDFLSDENRARNWGETDLLDMENDVYSQLTSEGLVSGIENKSIDTDFQKIVLMRYKDLIDEAKKVKELQDIIDMSNLGKSMWEAKQKISRFQALEDYSDFSNATSLVGEFSRQSGELYLGDGQYFTPTTNQGAMVGTAISLSRNLFFDYFPYYNDYIGTIMDDVILNSNVNINNPNQVVKAQEEVFQEMKKFITSATRNGIFLDTPKNERDKMFFDTDNSTSLSTYIADLFGSDNNEFSKGINTIRNNAFLSYLSYEKGESGKPSLIKFDNTEVANVSEEHFHQAFKELFIKDYPLPSKNGEQYSTRKLAQELVAYSHLSGGIVREAIEFHRFIPIEYYDSVVNQATNTTLTRALQNYDTKVTDWGKHKRLQNFPVQFFQNNPERATQFSKEFQKDKMRVSTDYMYINETMESYPQFVSIKNKTKSKLKKDKWSLYKHVKDNRYTRVDVLGEFGMSEYDYSNSNLQTSIRSVENKPVGPTPPSQNFSPVQPTTPISGFSISSSDSTMDVLNRIANNKFTYNENLSDVAKTLIDVFQDKIMDTNVEINTQIQGKGAYSQSKNTILINPKKAGSKMAETFLHEFVHSVTVRELKPFYNETWDSLVDNAPKEVIDLNLVFNEYQKKIKSKYADEYQAFIENYNKFKANDPNKRDFTPRELSVFYPTVNVKEFLAVSLSNNEDFITETSQMKYKKSGTDVRSKFVKVIDALLKRFGNTEYSFAEKILTTSLETIEALNKDKKKVKQDISPQEMKSLEETYNVMQQDDIFGGDSNPFGNPITPTEEDFQSASTNNIEVVKRYSVDDVKNNPDKIYIFGDNTKRYGKGGQAVIRDEENAFGIATKWTPSTNSGAYFTDDTFNYNEEGSTNQEIIDRDIRRIKADGRPVVFPKDGIGTGLAKLKEKAPQTYEYLKQRLLEEFGFNNDTGEILSIDNLPDCI